MPTNFLKKVNILQPVAFESPTPLILIFGEELQERIKDLKCRPLPAAEIGKFSTRFFLCYAQENPLGIQLCTPPRSKIVFFFAAKIFQGEISSDQKKIQVSSFVHGLATKENPALVCCGSNEALFSKRSAR